MSENSKERPILFKGEMVRAVLVGRKTQTRRLVKNPNGYRKEDGWPIWEDEFGDWQDHKCPYGQPGDRLWVRETHRSIWSDAMMEPCIQYRADGAFREPKNKEEHNSFLSIHDTSVDGVENRNWRPSIFLKRQHARILLEVVAVRVERLQDISEDDSNSEGVLIKDCPSCGLPPIGDQGHECDCTHGRKKGYRSAKGEFRDLWETLHGKRSEKHGRRLPYAWSDNPWVWVVEFKVIER